MRSTLLRPSHQVVYETIRKAMTSMAASAGQLQPLDLGIFTQNIQNFHEEAGKFSQAFYSIVNLTAGEFSWQYRQSETLLSSTKPISLMQFLERVHPDYLQMYQNWAMIINQTAYSLALGRKVKHYVYHISLPLKIANNTYHWFTQHSIALQTDDSGYYVSHFNYYHYNGKWFSHNRPPFLPYVTNNGEPVPDVNQAMTRIAARKIREYFTPTEQALMEWYMKGELASEKLRMQPHTLHEHNRRILKMAENLLLTDFKSAREAALFLFESELWQLE
ncbi:MAG: hypothetical protein JNN28_04630 [Saprospiraceae bacterium]|nr:hypothetical protein [Saprospiraceae bacterium]